MVLIFSCEACLITRNLTDGRTDKLTVSYLAASTCLKGTFKNYVILFGGMSDPPPPPVNSLSTFGIPPLPPLKDDVIFEQDLDQISVQLYYSRGFKVNTSGYLKANPSPA